MSGQVNQPKETAMKTQATVSHVGMDCHRTFSRLTARDAENRVVFRRRLEHADRERLRAQLRQLPAGTPVILEGSFGWGWLADELGACRLAPHLANCRKVDQWREARGMAKTNQLDADLLSELWPQRPRWWEVWLAPQAVRDQREWLRYRMGLVQVQTMTKNRVHATLHRHGILNPFSDLFGRQGQAFLQELVQAEERLRPAARQTLAGHLALLAQLRRQIAQASRTFRRQVQASATARLWDSLPGIGQILAYTIDAEVGDVRRFTSSRKLARYSLLAPLADDSGEETGEAPLGRHVGHLGRLTLKWAFIEAAHGAVRKSAHFREVFERCTDGGRHDRNRGYIAVARHLSHVGLACVKKQTPYREERPPRPGQARPAVDEGRRPESGQPDHPRARSHPRRQSDAVVDGAQACL